jgi:hypothetical protein
MQGYDASDRQLIGPFDWQFWGALRLGSIQPFTKELGEGEPALTDQLKILRQMREYSRANHRR